MTGPSTVLRSSGSPILSDFARAAEPLDDFVVRLLLHQHAGAGRADLAGIEEDAGGRSFGRGFEIGIVENDVGRLAAELERDALEVAGRALHDSAADAGRAGEGDLVDVGVIDQRVADDAAGPVTTLKTPAGRPASSASSAMRSADSEVSSAGFITMVQPQASAGASFHMPIISGKFHGTIAATTPTGSRTV